MSSGTNNRTKVSFLPIEFDLPNVDNPSLLNQVMNERERDTASAVNQKEAGVYAFEELVNSQSWSFEANVVSSGFRRMYPVPALQNGVPVLIPHELGDISGFTFTDYKGWVQNALGTEFRPIPAEFIVVTPTDIEITGDAAYAGFTGQIVLEYIKS